MIIGFLLLIIWILNYPSSPMLKQEKLQICGTLVKSTCTDDFTTKWNTKNIANNLKMWMNRIEPIDTITPSEKMYYHISKFLIKHKENNIVKYIGNKNCLNRKTFGPIWKIAALRPYMKNQYHDGFLYGTEAENGTLSGILSVIKKPLRRNNQNISYFVHEFR